MEVYCALINGYHSYFGEIKSKHNLPPFNLLFSFFYFQDITPFMSLSKNIIIDSGGFSFQMNPKKTNSPDKYFNKYKKFVESIHNIEKVQGIFELDIDNMVGYDKVKEYRAELFEITQKIIPVWHKSLGVSEYKRLCQEYNYISIPCTKNRTIKKNHYGKFIKYAHNNKCKVHGLGMLQEKILNKVPFDTVDGTSWFKMARFGNKDGKKINSQYILNNREDLIFLELVKHIKFQEEMKNRWEKYHY